MPLSISKRVLEMQASPIRKLVPHANKAKEKGIKVYHLNIGQPDLPTPNAYWDAVHSYEDSLLAYGPSEGLLFLREAMAKYFLKNGLKVIPDEIMVTTAGSEALVFAFLTICNPEDEIIVFEPFYTNYNGFASMTDIRLVPVLTTPETGYHLPSKKVIEAKITSRTKGILFCSPNNPTGTVLNASEMDMLVEIALEHDLYLLSDEVYREFAYSEKPISVISYPEIEDRAIMIDSISKRFSACGARIGSIITRNQKMRANIMKLAQSRLCPPTLEQYGAAAAYALPATYYEDVRNEYRVRRDVVMAGLRDIPDCICQEPKGAFYVMAKLPIDDADVFSEWLLRDFSHDGHTVMLAPGAGFYATPGLGKSEVRIAYVIDKEHLSKAMDILEIAVGEYKRR